MQGFFVGKEDKRKRYETLHNVLGLSGGDTHYTFGIYGQLVDVLDDYNAYKRFGHWPFQGGKYDQPRWVIENFRTLDLLSEYFELDKEFGVKKVSGNVLRADQLFKDLSLKTILAESE